MGVGGFGGNYLDADCQLVDCLKPFVGKLQKETAFPDSSVADDDIFKEVSVTHLICAYMYEVHKFTR